MRNRNFLGLVLVVVASLPLTACGGSPAAAKDQAVQIQPVPESAFKRLVLTDMAAKRLAISTTPVREEHMTRKRVMGGEVVTPGGQYAVRVRLSPEDHETVDPTVAVRITPMNAPAGGPRTEVIAEPMLDAGPAFASGARSGVVNLPIDYTLPSSDHGFRPAQKVMVELALKGGGLRKLVPYSAIIYELDGRTSVYTSPESRTFMRAPVVVDYITGDLAVLSDGPPIGTQVVAVGATELYGAEVRTGK